MSDKYTAVADEAGYKRLHKCGHKHRTVRAAEECLAKLQAYNPVTNNLNATWAHGYVVNQLNQEVKEDIDGKAVVI